ncbi:MAG: iron ABC transporter permease [Candidatus Latescibacteria bacterium]|nr:iron ABC transporter permease [Candidatus Latescibacterota bacterium]
MEAQYKDEAQGGPRHAVIMLGLFLLLLVAFGLSLSLGSVHIPLAGLFGILTGEEVSSPAWAIIVHTIRLPKAITAVLAGAALSVSGLQMQTLFRNPLADPFVLGISAGASLGVAIVVLTVGAVGSVLIAGMGFLGDLSLAVAAIIGAATVLGCVLLVSRSVQSVMTLLILGLMFGYATGAFVSILIYFSVPEQIQSYILWTFGSFGSVTWRQMPVLISAIFFGLLLAFLCIKPLNALLLGENYARSMGLNVKRIRLWILISASILAGATTAFCGPIAFLGLAVPHLCRSLLHTSDHRVLMPAVTCLGATLALLSDLIAHLPGSQFVLPLNAVTSLIGAPIVIWFILHRKNLGQAFS